MPLCKFKSSYGGFDHCKYEAYLYELCEFHYGCFADKELDEHGALSDRVTDQIRRRQINFFGLEKQEKVYLSD